MAKKTVAKKPAARKTKRASPPAASVSKPRAAARRKPNGRGGGSEPKPVSPDQIAVRAYYLYIERGAVDGYELEDWLRAERELSP